MSLEYQRWYDVLSRMPGVSELRPVVLASWRRSRASLRQRHASTVAFRKIDAAELERRKLRAEEGDPERLPLIAQLAQTISRSVSRRAADTAPLVEN